MSKKIFLIVFLGLLGFLILVMAFLPLIIRKVAVKNSKEWIGRSISIDKIRINYFTGRVKMIDFSIYEQDDSTPFIGFDTLIIDTEPYRLLSNEVVIEQLYLKGLNVSVIMNDSIFNFDDLVARFSGESTEDSSEEAGEEDPLILELSNLELKEGILSIHDAEIGKDLEMRNLDFFIPYIRLDQSARSEAGLKFDFRNGGYFESKIDIDPVGGDFIAELILYELDISGYNEFVAKYMDIGSFVGMVDLDLDLQGNIHKIEGISLSGLFQIHDFELQDNQQTITAFKSLNIDLAEADPVRSHFVIDTIKLVEPYLYFEMYDSTNNLVDLINRVMPPADSLITEAELDTITEKKSSPELYYALNNFIIDKGSLDIVDSRTDEPFRYYLSELQLSVDSISSNSTWVETHAEMLLNKRGNLVAEIGINPADPMDLRVDYTITDFMLSDLNIYSRYYMGFPILYGDMYYKAYTEIKDRQITSENKLIIHNVELGNKGSGIHNLPLKFALFLLKDKDGVITLDVPVRGDLNDPKVSVGKIVWNTFKNLIIKAAAAPVKLLSGLIGADPKDIGSIEYDYLDTIFSEQKQKQLDLLLRLEQQKPELEIELIYYNDQELEKQQIAMTEVGRKFGAATGKDYKNHVAEFEEFVRSEVNSDTLDMLNACLRLIEVNQVDSLSAIYNQERINDLTGYLKAANDSTEIIIVPDRPGAPKNIGSKPVFEVKYGMKEEHL